MTDYTQAAAGSRAARGRVAVETGRKRVRAYAGGRLVADTLRPLLVWEAPYYPTYYVPRADVRAELVPTGEERRSPSRGTGIVHDVRVGGVVAAGAALLHPDSPIPELRDAVRLAWDAMDEWLEEDEPVYTHPRDPYTRVDVLASTRHVLVEVDGVVLAESRSPRLLFETHLPPRLYLPPGDVRTALLRPSDTVTHCPYKGAAGYFSVELPGGRVLPDLAWTYRYPLPESQKVAGLVAFFDEQVDVTLDGVRQERPRSRFG